MADDQEQVIVDFNYPPDTTVKSDSPDPLDEDHHPETRTPSPPEETLNDAQTFQGSSPSSLLQPSSLGSAANLPRRPSWVTSTKPFAYGQAALPEKRGSVELTSAQKEEARFWYALTAPDSKGWVVANEDLNNRKQRFTLYDVLANRGIDVAKAPPVMLQEDNAERTLLPGEVESPRGTGGEKTGEQGGLVLRVPPQQAAEDNKDQGESRKKFAARIFNKLRDRGIHGVRTFRVMCHHMDFQSNGVCSARGLEGALAHMGIKLVPREYADLLRWFGTDEDDMVSYAELLSKCYTNLSVQRLEILDEAYRHLCDMCPGGSLTFDAMQTKCKPQALTSEMIPDLVESTQLQEFLSQWGAGVLGAEGTVSFLDFLDYYLDVSVSMDDDQKFCEFVCNIWGIHMEDLVSKKIFRQFAAEGDLEDTLSAEDFLKMLRTVDPEITTEEANAWLETVDEDDNGEITISEFLSSKVLRVKRLFDRYDPTKSKSINKKDMMNLLQEMNPSISVPECLALYECIDFDGNGEVSFYEFLESSILKLHDIFFGFDTDRSREFSETELKSKLQKLDPFLSDFDLHLIYKAIDTDSNGRVSFVEIVESHVLRAKALFDCYDINRRRMLTKNEFRELLKDVDEELTELEVEAVFDVVSGTRMAEVSLGDFLNPNVVRLKLLFDKYDNDNSHTLEPVEFKKMLKELYRNSTERDIELLVAHAFPNSSIRSVSFVDYFKMFKDIDRRREIIDLEKKRDARRKEPRLWHQR